MAGFLNDFKHAFRVLRNTRGFTAAALLVLALGIGANTSIFSIVYGVLLRPLPFADPDRLVQLFHVPPQKQFPGMTRFFLSAANYLDWEQQNDVFEKSAVYAFTSYRLTGSGEPQVLQASRVEPTFFSVLGVQPLLGRAITSDEAQAGHEHVVVLSHKFWKTQFGGDRGIVGREIQLNGQAYTVLGVMPSNFTKPGWAQLWSPLVWDPLEKVVRGEHHFMAIARLKPGVSVAQAQSQLSTIAERLAQQYPADDARWGATVVPLREETVGEVRKPLLVLLGAVAFVLLIACANVANLMLAKVLDRRKEIAIRTALGANRGRIMRQVLSEAVLLSLAGGALGLVVAHFGTKIVVNFLGASLPRVGEIGLNVAVLAFTFAIAVVAGTAAGVAPAWRMSKSDPNDALKQGLGRTGVAGGGTRTRSVLVVTEVALSLVLLVGAGLLIRTLGKLRSVNPGFDSQHVLTMRVGVADTDFTNEQQQAAFYENVLNRVRALPGVQAAAAADTVPLQGGSTQPVAVEGAPAVEMAHQPEVAVRLISPQYFTTMRIPVVRGREFTDADTASSPPVVIISESMAKQFWPHENPIGKRLTLTFFPGKMRQVIGVVGDIKDRGLASSEAVSMLYWPIAQFVTPPDSKFRAWGLQLAVRTATEPESAAAAIRDAVHQVSPSTPLVEMQSMEQLLAEDISPQRFQMFLLAAFAGLALLLAAVGIYSVLAYAVRQRVREIGIRMALGAQVGDVLRMITFEGMRPTVLGVIIGLVGALALGRVLSSLVFGVSTRDAATFVSVACVLMGVGFLASIIPAYRATKVDPLKTLRDE